MCYKKSTFRLIIIPLLTLDRYRYQTLFCLIRNRHNLLCQPIVRRKTGRNDRGYHLRNYLGNAMKSHFSYPVPRCLPRQDLQRLSATT